MGGGIYSKRTFILGEALTTEFTVFKSQKQCNQVTMENPEVVAINGKLSFVFLLLLPELVRVLCAS